MLRYLATTGDRQRYLADLASSGPHDASARKVPMYLVTLCSCVMLYIQGPWWVFQARFGPKFS